MSDPVAEKSTFLCMYMSNHPDTLVAYVRYWGKVNEVVKSAKMTAIDSNVPTKDTEEKEVRVPFDPPLSGYEEVKPRLLSMTADAQEALGMSKAPQISTFHLPASFLKTGIPLALMVYTTLSPILSTSAPANQKWNWEFGCWLYDAVGGTKLFKPLWIFTGVVHFLEAAYVTRLCVKHRTGLVVGFQYVLSVFLFGFTVLLPFRKRIQQARIDSIMKGN
ncbi:uncharacterized protein FOMMEDRAFT_91170 [Fomitiporia mediterranea MF3/22]|uniref:uncharacterized protein n=1 Tax=Fomitiporia mediterranea (strain MF3/22) TaxID=694068 RepID=UPI0004407877|nr:uncharacterized protein FOMMEDRAFT_91170 [Fomitiporia mediterranea MF3/22]EJD00288.1 hypothetical protein FOMMEDRAFT_91170 [Fomitiporia mediterranea MF3/22]